MIITDQKGEEHIVCPYCRSREPVTNGIYYTKYYRQIMRLICRVCKKPSSLRSAPFADYFSGKGIKNNLPEIEKSAALAALGLPFSQIENLVDRKAETLRRQLLRCRESEELWGSITATLQSHRLSVPLSLTFLDAQLESAKQTREGMRKRPHAFWLKMTAEEQSKLCACVSDILGAQVVLVGKLGFFKMENDRRIAGWLRCIRRCEGVPLDRFIGRAKKVYNHVRRKKRDERQCNHRHDCGDLLCR